MDHQSRLSEGMGVHIADPPRQGRRDPVVLAVDDIPDPAHAETHQGRKADRVEQLPEADCWRGDVPRVSRARRSLRAADPPVAVGPDPDPEHGPEDAAPLADPALVDVEGLDRGGLEEGPVLDHEMYPC